MSIDSFFPFPIGLLTFFRAVSYREASCASKNSLGGRFSFAAPLALDDSGSSGVHGHDEDVVRCAMGDALRSIVAMHVHEEAVCPSRVTSAEDFPAKSSPPTPTPTNCHIFGFGNTINN